MRREWGAAGRDVAQVREGEETARESRSGADGVRKKRGGSPRGEWLSRITISEPTSPS